MNPYPGYVSAIYADPANWLCRPDTDDVCDHDLDATVVRPNGQTRIEHWHEARRPMIDCFYIYPTISTDPTGNSDLVPGADQELFVVSQQAARLGSVCRVFAPVYRQITLTALEVDAEERAVRSRRPIAQGVDRGARYHAATVAADTAATTPSRGEG